jgi:copper(I)-binding protein
MKYVLIAMLIMSSAFASDIKIENARVRLLPPTSPATGAFMKISNLSNKDIKLMNATSDASQITELHNHLNVDGIMKMRKVPFITVPAKGSVMLKPGSFHVMLIGLKKPLALGQKIPLKLKFDNQEEISINPEVKKIQAQMHKHRN